MSNPAERAGPKATRRAWLGLAVIALPCVLATMDLEVLNLAVPALSAALHPSGSQLLWIVDSYGFLVAGSLVTMGTLGDRIGRRRLLLIGAAAFGATSVLAAYATSPGLLIAARALLGVAGATLAPSTLSLVRGMFLDRRQRTVAVSIWAASFSAGAALGPVLGGVLLRYFWWGSVFLLAVPVMVLLLVLGPVLLPEFRDPDAGRLDLPSAAMSLCAVLALVYALKRSADVGPDRWVALSALAGVVVGAAFLRRQRRLSDPLLPLALFRVPAFSGALAAFTLSLFAGYGMFFLIAQYLQLVLGLSPLVAGLWSLPAAAGLVLGSLLAPALARLARPAYVMAAGLAVAAAGFGVLAGAGPAGGLAVPVLGATIFAAGIAPVGTLATDLVVGAAPVERAGSAAAISETAAELGGSLGIAVLGSLGTAVYRRQLTGALPADVPPDAAHAARDTLGAAVAAAAELPARLGAAVLGMARAAFTLGFQLAALAAAATAALLALLTAVLLRRVPRADAES
ncbi:MAG TPA: MFS transporter [Pseudonocardia sp.]|nr:MFS transporter [Pseudonocardia sp.]